MIPFQEGPRLLGGMSLAKAAALNCLKSMASNSSYVLTEQISQCRFLVGVRGFQEHITNSERSKGAQTAETQNILLTSWSH